jgi:hypothetical protein
LSWGHSLRAVLVAETGGGKKGCVVQGD